MKSQPFSPQRLRKNKILDSPPLTKKQSIKQTLSKQSQARQILNNYQQSQNKIQNNQNTNINNQYTLNVPKKMISKTKQQYRPIQSQIVNVQPKHYLQFQCTQFQTSAVLRIYINQNGSFAAKYKFNIKSTNRQDYKVTQPTGQLKPMQEKIIYFYLKQTASINKNLKDKFLLEITQNRRNGQIITIYSKKLTILIQCALNTKKTQANQISALNASSSNMGISKYLSAYKSPLQIQNQQYPRVYVNKSDYKNQSMNSFSDRYSSKKLNTKNNRNTVNLGNTGNIGNTGYDRNLLISKSQSPLTPLSPLQFTDQQRQYKQSFKQKNIQNSKYSQKLQNSPQNRQLNQNKFTSSQIIRHSMYDPQILQKMHIKQQELKTFLNQTIQTIQKKKRKKMILENQNKSTQARARFRIYLTIIMVILAFFFGMFVKSLGIKQGITNFWEQAQNKLSSFWNTQKKQTVNQVTNNIQTVNQYTQSSL